MRKSPHLKRRIPNFTQKDLHMHLFSFFVISKTTNESNNQLKNTVYLLKQFLFTI